MIPVLIFPQFDPVLLHLGPLQIRWYALAYIVALLLGWRLMRRLVLLAPAVATQRSTSPTPPRSSPSGTAACPSTAASSASSSR